MLEATAPLEASCCCCCPTNCAARSFLAARSAVRLACSWAEMAKLRRDVELVVVLVLLLVVVVVAVMLLMLDFVVVLMRLANEAPRRDSNGSMALLLLPFDIVDVFQ